jgi:hypothetical protein
LRFGLRFPGLRLIRPEIDQAWDQHGLRSAWPEIRPETGWPEQVGISRPEIQA